MADPTRPEDDHQNPDPVADPTNLHLPIGRIKRIIKLDKDIGKVNSEALFLIAASTELFLHSLTDRSARVARENKKKTVRLDHLRTAVKRHRPTADFLLDSLPTPPPPPSDLQDSSKEKPQSKKKKNVPFATRSIDAFFQKFT